MWKSGPQESWFSASFLAQVRFARLGPIVDQVKSGLGAYRETTGGAGVYISHFEKGTDEVRIHLDADGKIDGLFFRPPDLVALTRDDALARLRGLPSTVSYVLIEGRSERAALNADRPLAVGSAFKLAVLAALRDEIAAGHRRWNDIVPLQARWKSLPSGVLQTWPTRTPLTIATYATEMISVSDNTAADAVAALDGPATVARYASRNVPFLTTRDLFVLRSRPDLAARWIGNPSVPARVALRDVLAKTQLPDVGALPAGIGDLRIEWLFTARELCTLMDRVADLPLMSVNPGPAAGRGFRNVAFKGGSEPGVLSLVTSGVTKTGTAICFALTVNDPGHPIDDSAVELAYGNVLGVLAR
jgi:hypothetical protein